MTLFPQPPREVTASDPALMREVVAQEGRVPYMYLDGAGNVTVGIGQLLATPRDAEALPFSVDGSRPITVASGEAKAAAWARVKRASTGLPLAGYRPIGGLVLSNFDIDLLFRSRVQRFLNGLHSTFPDFRSYPYEAQLALLDLAYNAGSVTARDWPALTRAVRARDWRTAATESHRTARVPNAEAAFRRRNAYTRELFLTAAGADTLARPRVP